MDKPISVIVTLALLEYGLWRRANITPKFAKGNSSIMKLSSNYYVFILAVVTCTVADESLVKDNLLETANDRTRRDLGDFNAEDLEKRQREFIGKRFRDFVGKRSNLGSYELSPDDQGLDSDYGSEFEKRLREFVGKRFSDNDFEKRMREFLGKRDLDMEAEKRQREFVGKRSEYEQEDEVEKRMRDFVGKRFSDDDSYLVKRLREFVGKRFTPEDIVRMSRRHRLFLQRPVYRRELIGK